MSDYSLPKNFDRIIHQPSRLAIMAVLAGCESADFIYMCQATNLNKGTLSKHLTTLEESGYIEINKTFKGKYPNTSAKLTLKGRQAFKKYRSQYREFSKTLGDE